MGKISGIGIFLGVTGLGILWYYAVMYNWLWLGLVNAQDTGWILGFGILFILFLFLSIPVTILLGLGYLASFALCECRKKD